MNYPDYDPAINSPPLSDDELDAFDDLLRALPADAAMNAEALDGYLAALVVGPGGPTRLKSAVWLPAVWGGDGPGSAPFVSEKQRKRSAMLVLRHLHTLDRQFASGGAAWEPVLSIAEQGEREWVDAEDWCAGFLQAVALEPALWAPVFDDPALAETLAPLVLLGAEESALSDADHGRLAGLEARDSASRAVVDAVLALHAHLHPAAPAPVSP